MGNIITNTSSLTTALDLADGNAKIKKDLAVVGKSTFTGDSTFNGNLSVTNGKINNVDVPALNTDVTKLKTDVTALNSTVDSVKAGSFEGKAISGATDVTATGTGTFKALKTTNIDINGDILSSTGKKYIISNATSGLSMTNGLTDTKANSLTLKADGVIQLTSAPQQPVKINEMSISRIESSWDGKKVYFTSLSGLSNITSGRMTINESMTVKDSIEVTENVTAKKVTTSGLITGTGGVKAGSLTVDGASTLTGVTTATGQIVANGGVKAASLTVDGASTLTGAITATGALTANGGISTSTINASGDVTLNTAKATGLLKADGGLTTTTFTATDESVLKNVKATGPILAEGGLTASTLTTSGATTLKGDLNAKNVVIGTNKWVIEEVVDANKGNRLCFGKADAQGTKTYWTCMNNTGNLELF